MLAYLWENLSTILVGLALLALVVWISVRLFKQRKSGNCAGCACGSQGCCGTCASHKQ